MIVIVMGLPGSGKSYFAERLANLIKAEYVNSDRLRKQLFQKRSYSKVEKAKVYLAMLEKLKVALDQGRNLVLDATFHLEEFRRPFIQMTKGNKNCFWIEVWAKERIIQERLQRTRPFSEANVDVYQLLRLQWEPFQQSHLRLESTNQNIDVMIKRTLAYLYHDTGSNQ